MQPTILLVEDNPITRKMVRFALEKKDFVVLEAPDGETALRLFASRGADLILQDLILPDMEGFALVARLRALPRGAEVPILAFSGFLSKLEEARISAVGFNDVITKPCEPSRLLQIIQAHLPTQEVSPARFGQGRSLVLADDDAVQRKLVSFRLSRAGFTIRAAADGAEALELARASPPDAIVADIMMPQLDGFALCMAARQDSSLAAVPIILITNSYVEEADRDLARRAGATDYLLRTPDLQDVLQSLRAHLGKGAPPQAALSLKTSELEVERAQRILKQLERQVVLNAGLSQRCTALSAELSVLSGISGALARHQEVDAALRDILIACFDAGGISIGALYLSQPDGALRVHKVGSLSPREDEQLQTFFGDPALLRALIERGALVAIPTGSGGGAPFEARLQEALDRSELRSMLVIPLQSGGAALGALVMLSRSAALHHEDRVTFAQNVANQISQALALAHAFAEKDASEQRARAQARILRSVLESIAEGVIVADGDGTIAVWNPAAEAILRMEPPAAPRAAQRALPGLYFDDRSSPVPPEESPLARAMRGESLDQLSLFLCHDKAPQGVWLSGSARPLRDEEGAAAGGVAVFRDVTRERAAQEQLMVSDRMASVGTLAAGVAHEINNPLAAVLGNLDFVLRGLSRMAAPDAPPVNPAEIVEALTDARDAADRVRQIVLDLKLFSRAEEEERGAVDIRRVLESSLRMAWNEIRHRARLVREYGDTPQVDANEARLGQVFLNLIVNAAQAIPEGQADDNEIRVRTEVDADGRVVVSIRDTGAGIPPEVMRRLFTPFFTTKPAGVGTGLGLSICQRLVMSIGGEIRVESQAGKGTTFRVLLPPIRGEASAPEPREQSPAGSPPRRGRILVVDDEAAIGSTLRRALSEEHDIESLTNAREALRRLAAGDRFDVILCDLMMPVMTGVEFYEALSRVDPEQARRIIFMTGGAFTPTAKNFLDGVQNPRLEKPFDLQLLRALLLEQQNR